MKLAKSLAPPAAIARRGFAGGGLASGGLASGGPEAVPGLILALAFDAEGRAGFLPVERPIDLAGPRAGWLWVHCDLGDGRLLKLLGSAPALSPPAPTFL